MTISIRQGLCQCQKRSVLKVPGELFFGKAKNTLIKAKKNSPVIFDFKGNHIRRKETEIGTLVSVTLKTVPDAYSRVRPVRNSSANTVFVS